MVIFIFIFTKRYTGMDPEKEFVSHAKKYIENEKLPFGVFCDDSTEDIEFHSDEGVNIVTIEQLDGEDTGFYKVELMGYTYKSKSIKSLALRTTDFLMAYLGFGDEEQFNYTRYIFVYQLGTKEKEDNKKQSERSDTNDQYTTVYVMSVVALAFSIMSIIVSINTVISK